VNEEVVNEAKSKSTGRLIADVKRCYYDACHVIKSQRSNTQKT
jgi:hypothetical protein